jgi:hypothetical protein
LEWAARYEADLERLERERQEPERAPQPTIF